MYSAPPLHFKALRGPPIFITLCVERATASDAIIAPCACDREAVSFAAASKNHENNIAKQARQAQKSEICTRSNFFM